MNLLRLIGLNTLHGKDAPVRHQAQRRRIKTVMQEMVYKAGRMIHHAGRWVLGLGPTTRGMRCLSATTGAWPVAKWPSRTPRKHE